MEITDLNKEYLKRGKLRVELFGRGLNWFDTGTEDGLLEASCFIKAVQDLQGLFVACIEEIAYHMGYISKSRLYELSKDYKNSLYGQYIKYISENELF